MHTIFFKQRNSTNLKIGGMSRARKPPVNWWNSEHQKPRKVIANKIMLPDSDGRYLTKNKKGTIMIQEAIILAFAAFILLFMITFLYNIYKASSVESDDGSKANFDALYEQVKLQMYASNDHNSMVMNYYINKKFKLLGFDTGATTDFALIARDDGSSSWRADAYKPSECGQSACLCLYDDDPSSKPEESHKGVLKCRYDGMADKNVVFSRTDMFSEVTFAREIELGLIYIEKTKLIDGRYEIYINDIDTEDKDDPANKRRKSLGSIREIPNLISPIDGEITSKAPELIVSSVVAPSYHFYARKSAETVETASEKACSQVNYKQFFSLSYNTNYFWSARLCSDSSCENCGSYAGERSFIIEHIATESTDGWSSLSNIITDGTIKQSGLVSIKMSDSSLIGKSATYTFESSVALDKISFYAKSSSKRSEIKVSLTDSSGNQVKIKTGRILSARKWHNNELVKNDFKLLSASFDWDKINKITFENGFIGPPFTDLWIDGLDLK